MAIYVPSNSMHAVLSLDKDAVLISVIGPQPVESLYTRGHEYYCPACGLETPAANVDVVVACPRCHAKLRLEKAGDFVEAAEIAGETPPGAEAR
jgi:DNA-directed RNA polymerase subunit RPC12/RpoP